MNIAKKIALLVVLISIVACGAKADSLPTLALDPTNGALTGSAGTTVGWGFTFTNNGDNYAVISGSDFCTGALTSPCSNSFGTYTDLAGAQFLVVAPGTSFSQAFNDLLQTGMGSFLINPASTGSILGNIVMTYDLYSTDPNSANFNPDTDSVSFGNYLKASASVAVGTTVPTPEPATFLLLMSGLAVGLAGRKRLR